MTSNELNNFEIESGSKSHYVDCELESVSAISEQSAATNVTPHKNVRMSCLYRVDRLKDPEFKSWIAKSSKDRW